VSKQNALFPNLVLTSFPWNDKSVLGYLKFSCFLRFNTINTQFVKILTYKLLIQKKRVFTGTKII